MYVSERENGDDRLRKKMAGTSVHGCKRCPFIGCTGVRGRLEKGQKGHEPPGRVSGKGQER